MVQSYFTRSNGQQGEDQMSKSVLALGILAEVATLVLASCHSGLGANSGTDAGQAGDTFISDGDAQSEGARVWLVRCDEDCLLELLPLAFKGGRLEAPIFPLLRPDRVLVDDFLAKHPDRVAVEIDDKVADAIVTKALEESSEIVVASSTPRREALAASMLAALREVPLLLDAKPGALLSAKHCIVLSEKAPGCATEERLEPENVASAILESLRGRNIEPNYVVVLGDQDPLAPAAVYLAAFRKAIPFFTGPTIAPADLAQEAAFFLRSHGIIPKFVGIVGHHAFVPSDHITSPPYAFETFYDYNYAQFDDDILPDVQWGRVVTPDLQDAFTLLNRTFAFEKIAKESRFQADIYYCDHDSESGLVDCFEEAPAAMCVEEAILAKRGISVRVFCNENMNAANFSLSLSQAGIVYKHSHSSAVSTTLFDEEYFSTQFPWMPQAPTYVTVSCFTANYPSAEPGKSYMLNFMSRGGVAYLGASTPGVGVNAQLGFLTRGREWSYLVFGEVLPGLDFHGDPALNPGFPGDSELGLETRLDQVSQHEFRLLVHVNPSAVDFVCGTALLAKGFDMYRFAVNSRIAYGIHRVRHELPYGENVIETQEVVKWGFDLPGVVRDSCPPAPKEGYETWVCGEVVPPRALGVGIQANGEVFDVVHCRVDLDTFRNQAWLDCLVGTPFVPKDVQMSQIARLLDYEVRIVTKHTDVACEVSEGVCAVSEQACPGSYKALGGKGCPATEPVCCVKDFFL